MLSSFFERHWYALPGISALLLVLSFHPFNIWPLVFVALAPLYYFVAAYPGRRLRQVFFGGFLTGGLFALSLSYFTVVQFKWISGTYLFVDMVHLSFIPIGLAGGILCGGACTLAYRALRTDSEIVNILVGAAAYTIGELFIYTLSGGYYFAMLAYAVSDVKVFMLFAPVGGAFFVSFLVALVNSSVAAGFISLPSGFPARWGKAVAVIVLALAVLHGAASWYEGPSGPVLRTLSIKSIQVSSRENVGFGSETYGNFVFPQLAGKLRDAARSEPDLLVYPFSPVEGALYTATSSFNKNILVAPRSSFAAWLTPLAASTTTVMIWTTLYDGTFSNVFEFFKKGDLVAQYQKRDVFPFIDYTPQWAQKINFYTTQVDMVPGTAVQEVDIDGVAAGAMLCSEIHQQGLARTEASRASVIISAGSEAIFVDDVASEYSLRAAQFRAAENNIPVLRANVLGPSAIIKSDGSILSSMKRGESGVLSGVLEVRPPHPTVFTRWGNIPVLLFLCGIFAAALAIRRRTGTLV